MIFLDNLTKNNFTSFFHFHGNFGQNVHGIQLFLSLNRIKQFKLQWKAGPIVSKKKFCNFENPSIFTENFNKNVKNGQKSTFSFLLTEAKKMCQIEANRQEKGF